MDAFRDKAIDDLPGRTAAGIGRAGRGAGGNPGICRSANGRARSGRLGQGLSAGVVLRRGAADARSFSGQRGGDPCPARRGISDREGRTCARVEEAGGRAHPQRGRSGWGAETLYQDAPGQWHVLVRPLRRPWSIEPPETGPTFNAYVNGLGFWDRGGARRGHGSVRRCHGPRAAVSAGRSRRSEEEIAAAGDFRAAVAPGRGWDRGRCDNRARRIGPAHRAARRDPRPDRYGLWPLAGRTSAGHGGLRFSGSQAGDPRHALPRAAPRATTGP